jgi:hypothetical protein
LCHTLNRCKVAYFHGKRQDSYPMQTFIFLILLDLNLYIFYIENISRSIRSLPMKISYLAFLHCMW